MAVAVAHPAPSQAPGIIDRRIRTRRVVQEFQVMINHDPFLDAGGVIVLNGSDPKTAGILVLI